MKETIKQGIKPANSIRRKKLLIFIVLCIIMVVLYCGCSPLIYTSNLNQAIRENDKAQVEQLLKRGGDINRFNSIKRLEITGNFPLSEACAYGNLEIVQLLLEYGAEVNTEEWTPLMMALTNEYPERYEVVKLLIEHGAELNGRGDSPIIMLLSEEYNKNSGRITVNVLKDKAGHDEMYEVFLLLVESGASLENSASKYNSKKSYPETLMHYTAFSGNIKIMEYMIKEQNRDINAQFYDGETVLMVAAKNNRYEMVEYLLQKGADKTLKNITGQTAQDIAKENREIFELLKEWSY